MAYKIKSKRPKINKNGTFIVKKGYETPNDIYFRGYRDGMKRSKE